MHSVRSRKRPARIRCDWPKTKSLTTRGEIALRLELLAYNQAVTERTNGRKESWMIKIGLSQMA
jgi:hypothetical protein